ncbi:hypothetical protein M405DRAFT_859995 [Rhizopogon salebrosus TDB-379]|nr:hypothetical protein M405DRAFT_859995 [Rhizopogon salebrosus TDB-379]
MTLGIRTGKPAGVQMSTRTRDIPIPVYPRVPAGMGLRAESCSMEHQAVAKVLIILPSLAVQARRMSTDRHSSLPSG